MKALLLLTSLAMITASLTANADLVAYYDFNDGTATDQSTFGNNGTVGSALAFNAGTPFGAGQALQADGTTGGNGIVTVPNAPSLQGITHELTLALWIRADSAQNPNWFRFMRKGTAGDPGQTWMWNRNADTQDTNVRVDTNNGTNGTFNQNRGRDTDVVLDNTWHQLVFTLNNGNWAEYLDGQASGSGIYDHGDGFANSAALQIAGRGGADNMTGFLDDVGVWDHALSPGEARSIQQFASDAALAYDLGEVNQLMGLSTGQQATINGQVWLATSGLSGAEGVLESNAGDYAINFNGGLGVVTIPEPSSGGLLVLGLLFLHRLAFARAHSPGHK